MQQVCTLRVFLVSTAMNFTGTLRARAATVRLENEAYTNNCTFKSVLRSFKKLTKATTSTTDVTSAQKFTAPDNFCNSILHTTVISKKSAGATNLFGNRRKSLRLTTFSQKRSSTKGVNGCKSFQIQPHQSPGYCSHAIPLPGPDVSESSPPDITQGSEEWFALRRHRLTASAFSTALGFWGDRRVELWEEKVFRKEGFVSNQAMLWGSNKEGTAVERYKDITGNVVEQLGFQIYHKDNEQLQWLGASPDGLITRPLSGLVEDSGGILEVKCPFNKGKPELGLPWASAPYYYMPQVQGLMEILDRNWVDLYCWTPTASSIFRLQRDHDYWALIFEPLREFWLENVVPAGQALETHGKDNVYQYKPSPQHSSTNHIIAQSKVIAKRAPLICKEISGHVEFFL